MSTIISNNQVVSPNPPVTEVGLVEDIALLPVSRAIIVTLMPKVVNALSADSTAACLEGNQAAKTSNQPPTKRRARPSKPNTTTDHGHLYESNPGSAPDL